MSDLFKKLNILVKSSLNDLVGDTGSPRRKALTPERLGKDIDREIAALRQRINEALDYEDGLKQRVQQLQDEVARLDQQADDAVVSGSDDNARYLVEQMQRAQQRLAMAEADLRDHRLVTQELITRVNTLDAAVADARRAQEAQAQQASAPEAQTDSEEQGAGRALADVLRDAREKVTAMGDTLKPKDDSAEPPAVTPAPAPQNEQSIEDDLARRRQRLSK